MKPCYAQAFCPSLVLKDSVFLIIYIYINSFFCLRAWRSFTMPFYATSFCSSKNLLIREINVGIWISSAPPFPRRELEVHYWLDQHGATWVAGNCIILPCAEGILRGNWTMRSHGDTKATALSDSDRSVRIILRHVAKENDSSFGKGDVSVCLKSDRVDEGHLNCWARTSRPIWYVNHFVLSSTIRDRRFRLDQDEHWRWTSYWTAAILAGRIL